jgi:hypothetical protein
LLRARKALVVEDAAELECGEAFAEGVDLAGGAARGSGRAGGRGVELRHPFRQQRERVGGVRSKLCQTVAGDLQRVANSATLVYGAADAVLVDTFTSIAQGAERRCDQHRAAASWPHPRPWSVFCSRSTARSGLGVCSVESAAWVMARLFQS